jgi:hypothetical protein
MSRVSFRAPKRRKLEQLCFRLQLSGADSNLGSSCGQRGTGPDTKLSDFHMAGGRGAMKRGPAVFILQIWIARVAGVTSDTLDAILQNSSNELVRHSIIFTPPRCDALNPAQTVAEIQRALEGNS